MPIPLHGSPPTSTVSRISYVSGSISATRAGSSLTQMPCSSAASQSGEPITSNSAIRPSLGSGCVVGATGVDVDETGTTVVDCGGTDVASAGLVDTVSLS